MHVQVSNGRKDGSVARLINLTCDLSAVTEGDPRDQRRPGVHRAQGPGQPPRPRHLRESLRQVSGGGQNKPRKGYCNSSE